MLDQNMLEQLKGVFSKLENKISLKVDLSEHPKQDELIKLLNDVSSTSENIHLEFSTAASSVPQFTILKNDLETGIKFIGIPGGHEFTSLILAILNSDLKGKFPDEFILNRIKKIKGPVRLRTFISLSCENCPEVVQALNLFSIIHSDFSHTMIDGEFQLDEIERLKIQGVPAVFANDILLSSGKISLTDLLSKLEAHFGVEEVKDETSTKLGEFDVVVLGAGPAGASAAIYAARKGLKTVVVAERVGGQVKDTKGIENLISVKYTEGSLLANQLKEHMEEYPIKILEHRKVDSIENLGDKKIIFLNSNEEIIAKSIIVATGAKWRELNIPGEKEYIGRGVAFCPHCDGPFYKNKKVAVVGGGNSGVEAALDLSQIVSEVVLFEFQNELKADKVLVEKLKNTSNAKIYTGVKTEEILGDGSKVVSMKYLNRETNQMHEEKLDGVFVQIGLLPNSQMVKELVETNRMGEIVVDTKGHTSVNGIYAAGDVTNIPFKQIIISMGEGAKTALTVFEDHLLKS